MSEDVARTCADALAEARRLRQQGDIATARAIVEAELRRDSSLFEPLDLEAELLVEQRNAPLALRLLEEYQRFYPDDGRVSARIAWVHWSEGRRDEALAEVRAALARDPGCAMAREFAAEWCRAKGEHAEALRLAEEGLALEPDNRGLLMGAAIAAAHLRNETTARAHFENALRLYPDDDKVLGAYGRFLLDMNHSGEAAKLLAGAGKTARPHISLLMAATDAHFRARQFPEAFALAERIATESEWDDPAVQRDLQELLAREAGTQQADELAFRLIGEARAVDCFGVEFLERCGMRQNRSHLTRTFELARNAPHKYPRTLARFLSTFYEAPATPGLVSGWVQRNMPMIMENTILWGGVGAWYVARGKWREASEHLASHHGRPDVKPWMLKLLGTAHEAQGHGPEANAAYRSALALPPDHSEFSIRSRLAYNMAMESMPGAGELLLMECSAAGREMGTMEDVARAAVVKALHQLYCTDNAEERAEIISSTEALLTNLAKADANLAVKVFKRQFRKKAEEL